MQNEVPTQREAKLHKMDSKESVIWFFINGAASIAASKWIALTSVGYRIDPETFNKMMPVANFVFVGGFGVLLFLFWNFAIFFYNYDLRALSDAAREIKGLAVFKLTMDYAMWCFASVLCGLCLYVPLAMFVSSLR